MKGLDYYQILEVPFEANQSQIKAAFRKKIKEAHPDLRSKTGPDDKVHQILEAYEVLSSQDSRKAYDLTYARKKKVGSVENPFNYREWLRAREDAASQAKLIFYDSISNRTDEALLLFETLQSNDKFNLEKLLGREDYMDCGFMLALEMEKMGSWLDALKIYMRIAELETQKAYFRHFFIEVEQRILGIVQRRDWEIGRFLVQTLEACLTFGFIKKNRVIILKKLVEVYNKLGQGFLAQEAQKKLDQLAKKVS